MEAYEDFCKEQFARIQAEAIPCDSVSTDEGKISFIKFHGVAVLSPLLTIEKREEMQHYKLKAIELDEKRQYCKKKTLLNRVQEILESVQVKNTSSNVNVLPITENGITDQTSDTKNMNGFALLPNIINLPIKSAQNASVKTEKLLDESQVKTKTKLLEVDDDLPLRPTTSPILNHAKMLPSEIVQSPQTSPFDILPPTKEAPDPYVMSLQNLLKKSREYIEREQSRRNIKNNSKAVANESNSDKENDTIKISDSLKEKAKLLNRSRCSSPLMVDKPALNKSNTLLQASSSPGQSLNSTASSALSKVDFPLRSGICSGVDMGSEDDLKNAGIDYESSIVKSLTGSYAKLPSPEQSLSPQMHRRRPRTLSAGHIFINNPVNAYDLSPNKKGNGMDCGLPKTAKMSSSEPIPVVGCNAGICSFTNCSLSKNDRTSSSGAGDHLQKCFVSSVTHADNKAAGECTVTGGPAVCKGEQPTSNMITTGKELELGTLSQDVDVSVSSTEQEIRPIGSTEELKGSSPAPLNKSYDVETPSPILIQSQVTNHITDTPSTSFAREQYYENSFEVKRRLEPDLDSTLKDAGVIPVSTDQEKKLLQERRNHLGSLHLKKNEVLADSTLEENLKKKMLAFEEMKKKLEEQHTQQLLLLIAEQEREQERLQREFEEGGKKLKFKNVDASVLSGNIENRMRPDRTNMSESAMSQSVTSHMDPHHSSPSHISVGPVSAPLQHNYGSANETLFGLRRPLQSGAPKVTTQRSLGRARTRWSQVYSPAMQKKFDKVTALAKGFLTRRLMQTEKLKNLKQTVKDTAEFMRTFHTERAVNRGIVSAQDASLRERVLAQLRAAVFEIHDIFFAMDVTERMHILVNDRELRREKLIRQMEKVKSPRDRVNISSATQKSLDRKRSSRTGVPGVSNKKLQSKPKASDTRILQPNQVQNAPINKLLCRQGSIYQKNPKKEAKCCDNLRRQHSLG
ncbi:centriolar coiled-coil protein of 110 kDa [Pelobates fuscus]|uniref:centriolar coiled-coil protein of 110 kDa n=1 Tax=Pelobates fuscus TaxID=191477 RepID=UPI002FE47A25